ncbi:uncharacterized protein Z519_09334 [Cladophialophora bantiana CBS 173.52]|uniref:Uncharacterized protein n=1 Tax=Cladophialophora bantiana (strain ATCC 10958 / CBS 173.52 / CDC B-1940 / NIH 8579) TaxID=1442370 RepID=A0A0D2HGI5_CLAB1|nr:uncharacterized protein Z519_09334 [Cladophialophora bantiana CBS 173.52]KIW89905.1 hypothetical protein Z519_09334 [Cladophialophora bantiana CBS 173.52]
MTSTTLSRGQVIGEIDKSQQKFLKTNCSSSPTSRFTQSIRAKGSTTISIHAPSRVEDKGDKSAVTLTGRLSKEYISGTVAEIRTAVGIKLGARRSKKVTVKIWRPIYNDQDEIARVDVEHKGIRCKSGQKREETDDQVGLQLTLEDFAYCRKEDEYPSLAD